MREVTALEAIFAVISAVCIVVAVLLMTVDAWTEAGVMILVSILMSVREIGEKL